MNTYICVFLNASPIDRPKVGVQESDWTQKEGSDRMYLRGDTVTAIQS